MCKNCVQKYAILFGTLQAQHAEHSLPHTHRHTYTDKVPAGHKDLSNQPGYKEQLVVVCVRARERGSKSAAARVIEIDEN